MDTGFHRPSCRKVAACLLLSTLAACTSLASHRQTEAFDEVSRQYRRAMLASDFEAALAVSGSQNISLPADLKHIRVVSYTLKKVNASEDGAKVAQEVEVEYYRSDSMLQKTARDHQQWEYHPDANRWVLTSGLPLFK